ncbi:MAG: OadG family protein [Clostridiaceae bacterium]|nr:OadG family protein [Clostridiaceae bacterium]
MDNIGIGEALGLSLLGMLVVFFMLVMLMGVIHLLGKGTAKAAAAAGTAPAAPPAPVVPDALPRAKGSCGGIDLHDVDDRTAAMLMAIVAEQIGAPLCELRFKSIRKVK